MKTLTNTPLFDMFKSYINRSGLVPEALPAAYDNFVDLLMTLPQDGDRVRQLRRLNYTRIELAFMRQACDNMRQGRHLLYDVFVGKTLALLDAEVEMVKETLRHGGTAAMSFKEEPLPESKKKPYVTLTWNGTDSDLIELVAALMAAGAIGSAEGRKLAVADVIRFFEDAFHLKINALYTKRGKVFDRCTDSTPFIDSIRKSYIRMLDERLA